MSYYKASVRRGHDQMDGWTNAWGPRTLTSPPFEAAAALSLASGALSGAAGAVSAAAMIVILLDKRV